MNNAILQFQFIMGEKKEPYLNKAHPDGTHLGQLIYYLKTVVDWLGQQLGKELVVENLQAAATGDLADSGRMESMLIITVTTLYKNAAVTHTLGIYLSSNVIEVNTFKGERERNPKVIFWSLQHRLKQGYQLENYNYTVSYKQHWQSWMYVMYRDVMKSEF